jgi:hypothetical protein
MKNINKANLAEYQHYKPLNGVHEEDEVKKALSAHKE